LLLAGEMKSFGAVIVPELFFSLKNILSERFAGKQK
jgi:hypothetical protein